MREHEQEFAQKGAALAAIGLADLRYARLFRAETEISFPLLVDVQRQAYRAAGLGSASLLHVFRKDNVAARKRARTAGHRQRRVGKNPFQLGGSFVFAPGNVDCYVHVSRTFADNAPISALLSALP